MEHHPLPETEEGVNPLASSGRETDVSRPTPSSRGVFPILKLDGLDSSMDKKYLMRIFDEKLRVRVVAIQVVAREDDEQRYAFIKFVNPDSAQRVMNTYKNWMPPPLVLDWFKYRGEEEEEGHRDKHPKIHHHQHNLRLLLPDVHTSDLLWHHRLSPLPTVERISIKDIKQGGAGGTCARIYGKVIAHDHRDMQVLYCRGPSESEEKRRGEDLKLKGPHCSGLDIMIYGVTVGIKLFEDRGDGQERVFARGKVSSMRIAGFYQVDVEGDGGVATVVFAAVPDAARARVCIRGLQNMRVYGCVKASREIVRRQSEFVMFARSLEDSVRVGPDGILPLDRSCVVASKRAGLTISLSLRVCSGDDDDGKWCVVRKDLVFDAVFRMEAQSVPVFGGGELVTLVTVSLDYTDWPGLDSYDNDDETCLSNPELAEMGELPVVHIPWSY